MKTRLRIVVLGYLVRGPIGGLAWHHLQYLLGLRALGHDVWFLEDSDDFPCCYDPSTHTVGTEPGYGLAFAAKVFGRLGLGDRWAYHDAHAGTWHGNHAVRSACESADMVLNVSAVNPLRSWLERIPKRVYVDTDPLFTQVRHLTNPAARERAGQHTHFFSFGERFGRANCLIPDDGFPWRPTRQPIFLDAWQVVPPRIGAPCTTVMQWSSYPPVEYGGRSYGMKSASFPGYRDLPARSPLPLEIALGSEGAPGEALRSCGWSIRDPLEVTADPWTYQDYIRDSVAEFTVAKHGYVASNSGWFSERSAAYLASGRPVVTQQTGFGEWLTADAAVLPFTTPDEAVAALERLADEYPRHARAARECAAEWFDSSRVLSRLLDAVT